MSQAAKPSVANYRDSREYPKIITVYRHRSHRLRFSRSGEPKIEEAYSTHLTVVGKRNPFAATESDPAQPEFGIDYPQTLELFIRSHATGDRS